MLTEEQATEFSRHLNLLLSMNNVTVADVQYKMFLFELFKKHYSSPDFPAGDVIRDAVWPKLDDQYGNEERQKIINELCSIWDEWKYICDEMLHAGIFKVIEE